MRIFIMVQWLPRWWHGFQFNPDHSHFINWLLFAVVAVYPGLEEAKELILVCPIYFRQRKQSPDEEMKVRTRRFF